MSTQGEPRSKRFKACRACRRQKMRCDGEIGKPCKRCRDFDFECLFDLMTPRAPRGHPKSATGPSSLSNSASSPQKSHELQANDAQPSPDPSSPSSVRIPYDGRPNFTDTLEFDQATNPVSAIHVMTSKATINSNDPHALASRRTGKSYPPNEELELANAFVRDAFRDEGQARDLFHLYATRDL